jgi:hypothetical protein
MAAAGFARPARAAPIKPKLVIKNLGGKVRIKLYLSVNLGPVNFSDQYMGTYYVNKNTNKTFVKNYFGAYMKYLFKVTNKTVTLAATVSAAGHTARKQIIRNIR